MASTTTLRGLTRTATTAVRSSPSMEMIVQQSASIWNRNPTTRTSDNSNNQQQQQPLRNFSTPVVHQGSENQELAQMLLLLSPTPPNTHEGTSVGSNDTSNSKAEERVHNSHEPQEHPRKLKEEEISQFLW